MNNRFFQQAEQFFKPMADMAALNAKTFEALAEKQTGFLSSVWSDGMNHARDLSDKRDVESFYTSQKDFWENMSQKFSTTAQDSFAILTDAQEKMTGLAQDSIASVDFSNAADAFSDTFNQSVNEAASAAKKQTAQAQNQTEQTASAVRDAAKTAGKAAQKNQTQAAKNASKAASAASSSSKT